MVDNINNSSETVQESLHETKYVVPLKKVHTVENWLKRRCLPDPQFPEGIISSVYYDGMNWKFLREKINSDHLKTKVRLRWYSHSKTGNPLGNTFLEAKYKIGSRRKKVRIETSYTAEQLSNTPLDNQLYQHILQPLKIRETVTHGYLCPVFQVTYTRYRFIEPSMGVRICIDYNINVPRVNAQRITNHNPGYLNKAVVEMKGNLSELPGFLQYLTALGCRKSSFSKYKICHGKIANENPWE